MDIIFVFEFEESFHINSIALRADSFKDALLEFSVVLGDCALHHVQSICKIC